MYYRFPRCTIPGCGKKLNEGNADNHFQETHPGVDMAIKIKTPSKETNMKIKNQLDALKALYRGKRKNTIIIIKSKL